MFGTENSVNGLETRPEVPSGYWLASEYSASSSGYWLASEYSASSSGYWLTSEYSASSPR